MVDDSNSRDNDLASVIDAYLRMGMRPNKRAGTGIPWTSASFAQKVGVTDRTVRNWRSGRSRAPELADMEQAFFGDDEALSSFRLRLRESFARAWTGNIFERHPTDTRVPRSLPFVSLGPLFKGREACVAAIGDAFVKRGSSVVALHGLGGVGKTRIAVEFAWINAQSYTALLFTEPGSSHSHREGIARLSAPNILNVTSTRSKSLAADFNSVVRWLQSNRGWLLIVDAVDDQELALGCIQMLPDLGEGKVLVTGRWAEYPAYVNKIDVQALATNDSADFIIERTAQDREHSADDRATAIALSGHLGALPLALEQAAAFIACQNISLQKYVSIWLSNRELALNYFDRSAMSYNRDVGLATTWLTTLDLLDDGTHVLLSALACFSPTSIPAFVIASARSDKWPNDGAVTCRNELLSYSLLSKSLAADGQWTGDLIMHKLLQEFVRGRDREEMRHEIYGVESYAASAGLMCALDLIADTFVGEPSEIRNWKKLDPIAPHALSVIKSAVETNVAEPTNDIIERLALWHETKGEYKTAGDLFNTIVDRNELFYIKDSPNATAEEELKELVLSNNIGRNLSDQGKMIESESYLKRALHLAIRISGPRGKHVSAVLNSIGIFYRHKREYNNATVFQKVCLSICNDQKQPKLEAAAALLELGEILVENQDFRHAHKILSIALAVAASDPAKEPGDCVEYLSMLAENCMRRGYLKNASCLYERALNEVEVVTDPDDASLIDPLLSYATALGLDGQFVNADPLLRRALSISRREKGLKNTKTGQICLRLASNCEEAESENLNEAVDLYKEGLDILRKNEPESAYLSDTLFTFAFLLIRLEIKSEAIEVLSEGLSILMACSMIEYQEKLEMLNLLLDRLEDVKEYDGAAATRRCISRLEKRGRRYMLT